jgi:hypothetical protein
VVVIIVSVIAAGPTADAAGNDIPGVVLVGAVLGILLVYAAIRAMFKRK